MATSIWSRIAVREARRAIESGEFIGRGIPTPCARESVMRKVDLGLGKVEGNCILRPNGNPERRG